MSEAGSSSAPPSKSQDRHEPRGRKPNDHLPPSRAREVQRAFRLRRAEHLASLEERILHLENENNQLRQLLSLPLAERPRIGSGPTGRGKSLKEGGVPMSERVRARKEARAKERLALGLPEVDTTDQSDTEHGGRDTATLSPRAGTSVPPPSANHQGHPHPHQAAQNSNPVPPLFNAPSDVSPAPFNYNLPIPFNLPVSPDTTFPDFTNNHLDSAALYKNPSGSTPNFGGMFNMFDTPSSDTADPGQSTSSSVAGGNPGAGSGAGAANKPSPISPPLSNPSIPAPDLLTRLRNCCHVADSHVVNDPGRLVFATRLCQSFGCSFGGAHQDPEPRSDAEHLTLEDSWGALKRALDPTGDADGENRTNTGKMAAELVIRAAHSRGGAAWVMCRYREGMSVKRSMVQALVQGLGGTFD
ncbi:hypothetical protein IAT38_007498 [Cryptococcus sp. DSM 104549]